MKTLIVSVAKAGHVNQCVAVCEAAGWLPGEIVRIPAPGRMTPRGMRMVLNIQRKLATWRALPRRREPGPLRIIASGAASEAVVAAYRALYGDDLFAAFSGRPAWRSPIFDVALVPQHSLRENEAAAGFSVAAAKRSILRRGVPVRRIARSTEGAALSGTLAMIGGVNKAFDVDGARIVDQVRLLSRRERNGPFTIAFSRRTPGAVEAHLRRALGPRDVRYIDRLDRSGFEQAMATAADFVVTPDSLTMVCEACAMGRPVLLFDLACSDPNATTARCIQDLLAGGEAALAPDGASSPARPGIFDIPPSLLAIYRGWEAKRSSLPES